MSFRTFLMALVLTLTTVGVPAHAVERIMGAHKDAYQQIQGNSQGEMMERFALVGKLIHDLNGLDANDRIVPYLKDLRSRMSNVGGYDYSGIVDDLYRLTSNGYSPTLGYEGKDLAPLLLLEDTIKLRKRDNFAISVRKRVDVSISSEHGARKPRAGLRSYVWIRLGDHNDENIGRGQLDGDTRNPRRAQGGRSYQREFYAQGIPVRVICQYPDCKTPQPPMPPYPYIHVYCTDWGFCGLVLANNATNSYQDLSRDVYAIPVCYEEKKKAYVPCEEKESKGKL